MPAITTTTSTHHIHVADETDIKATHGISLDTATLGLEADGVSISLFIWGEPAHVWDNLDAIIDACARLKLDIARKYAAEAKVPSKLSIV